MYLAKIQISLRVRIVWSASLLGASRVDNNLKFLHADNECKDCFESSLEARVRRLALKYGIL